MLRPVDLVLCASALVLLALVLLPRHGTSLSPARASWTLTPGALNPDVTQATISSTICTRGWTRTVRQMREYGRTGSARDYQEDHLISLELGGNPTDPRNLWPEPYPRAAAVDQIENELNAEICSGKITLEEGQRRESALKHSEG